jgi:starch synthase (maltosyl-transferring)
MVISVEPAGTCCANVIYNAFVRQFGPGKSGKRTAPEIISKIEALDSKGYTVIPESGKFRDLKEEIGFIFARLGCRVLQLLPIHPTPTTYARMGRFGSPYAALDFTEVDPALAVFDPAATPLEQFMELVDTVHYYSGYVIMDIAINHTGWAAGIHESHPHWLVREKDGEIQAPGAWGVVWADLTKLDYSHKDLWEYMAGIFLLWCHRGVDGFRCDAGYMIPVPVWEYIVAKVRQEYPDTLFFLEGLGGPLESTGKLLGQANFNWAYSELFQNYTLDELSAYLPLAVKLSDESGHLIHFAETHDNNRLASVSHTYAKMRTALCALYSVCGGFGFTNGVEWYADEKIDVHESTSLNWGNTTNQVDYISRLILILKSHPTFFAGASLSFVHSESSPCPVLLRYHPEYKSGLLVLVNLDCDRSQPAVWKPQGSGGTPEPCWDLITGSSIQVNQDGPHHLIRLEPGEVLALTCQKRDLDLLQASSTEDSQVPARVIEQKRKALVLSIIAAVKGYGDIGDLDIGAMADRLADDPVEFIRGLNTKSCENRVVLFDIEKDLNRQIMVPPGFFLMIKSHRHFRAELLDESVRQRKSVGYAEGMLLRNRSVYAALFKPLDIKNQSKRIGLNLRLFGPEESCHAKAEIMYLSPFETPSLRLAFSRREIARDPSLKLLSVTDKGAMMRAAADWGRLESRYDGLLGANIDPDFPEDRWMVLARYRIWAIYQGYSRELSMDCLQAFWASHDRGGKWRFHVPTSEGNYYVIDLFLSMDKRLNRVQLVIFRESHPQESGRHLADDKTVTLIVRPDIEDRSFHETVKAFTGPETIWPEQITPAEKGFSFALSRGPFLKIQSSDGRFEQVPEWQYMVHRPLETQRGLDPDSDLFSPGYFQIELQGGRIARLEAMVADGPEVSEKLIPADFPEPLSFDSTLPFTQVLESSLNSFIVERGKDKSVIAGYPWFLDWGRDSLIFCRALIEVGRLEDARSVLRLFGRFEKQGTLPNMIHGEDARNIETSDAPLWFFTCCKELMEMEGNRLLLDENFGGRTLRESTHLNGRTG